MEKRLSELRLFQEVEKMKSLVRNSRVRDIAKYQNQVVAASIPEEVD